MGRAKPQNSDDVRKNDLSTLGAGPLSRKSGARPGSAPAHRRVSSAGPRQKWSRQQPTRPFARASPRRSVPPATLRRALSDGALAIGAHRPDIRPPRHCSRRPNIGPQAVPRRRITSRALRPAAVGCGGGGGETDEGGGRADHGEAQGEDGLDDAFEEFTRDGMRDELTLTPPPPANTRPPRFNRQPEMPPGTSRCWLCGAYHAKSAADIGDAGLLTLFINAPIYYEVALARSPRGERGPLRRQASETHVRAGDASRDQQLDDAFLTQCVLSPSAVDWSKVRGAPRHSAPPAPDGGGCGCVMLDAYESMLAHLNASWQALPRETRVFVVVHTTWYTLQCNARDVHELLCDRDAAADVDHLRGQLKFLYSERLRLVRRLMLQLVKERVFVHYKRA